MQEATEKVTDLFIDKEVDADPPVPLEPISDPLPVETLWSTGTGVGTDEQFLLLNPLASGGAIYVADRDGDVTAINIENGKRIWKQETDARISGGPGIGEGMVLVGTSEAEVLALSQEEGEPRWTETVSSEVLATPRAADDIVVVRTIDGKLFGLDAASGGMRWTYDRTVPNLTLRGNSPPVLTDGVVLAGFDSGRLVALDLFTGKLIWETRVVIPSGRTDLDRMVDIDAEPLVVGETAYVVTFQGRLAAIDTNTGEIEWTRDISSNAGLSNDEEHIYITDADSHVWALDRSSGNAIWKQEELHARRLTAPVPAGEYIVVGDYEGYLHWLRRSDGSIATRIEVDDSPIYSPPLVIDGKVYAYSSEGKLASFLVQ